ncbi:hypothetical protein [Pseudoduganella rhizocola]|uniref:hypothetical protein n=1 Tax=Pseudoduganella rhizocola TaxID=3382643 RepID=UPI0038B629A7
MQRLAIVLLLCAALPVGGEELAGWVPVPDAALDEARGGFDGPPLVTALSIERLVSVNGAVVAERQLNLPDLGRALPVEALRSAALEPLLVQNSLNGQLISSQTTINTTVNSLSALTSLNFGDSLRQSLSQAVTPR